MQSSTSCCKEVNSVSSPSSSLFCTVISCFCFPAKSLSLPRCASSVSKAKTVQNGRLNAGWKFISAILDKNHLSSPPSLMTTQMRVDSDVVLFSRRGTRQPGRFSLAANPRTSLYNGSATGQAPLTSHYQLDRRALNCGLYNHHQWTSATVLLLRLLSLRPQPQAAASPRLLALA